MNEPFAYCCVMLKPVSCSLSLGHSFTRVPNTHTEILNETRKRERELSTRISGGGDTFTHTHSEARHTQPVAVDGFWPFVLFSFKL